MITSFSGWVTKETLQEAENSCWAAVGRDPVAWELKKLGLTITPFHMVSRLEDWSPWGDYCINNTRYTLNTVAASLMSEAYRLNTQYLTKPFWFRLVKS